MGYAFRNTSVTGTGITHVVVWDAGGNMRVQDRVSNCNVTVAVNDAGAADSDAVGGRKRGISDVKRWEEDGGGVVVVVVTLANGTVVPAAPGAIFPSSGGSAWFNVNLYDAPIVIAREDAIPDWQ
jgi:hypothetical protein